MLVGGWTTLGLLAWAAFWYVMFFVGTTSAQASSAWLIVDLLCFAMYICAQLLAIFAHAKLRRDLHALAHPNG